MIDAAKAADFGAGPWSVVRHEDGFYYLTLDGQMAGSGYPLMKTAAKACRAKNAGGGIVAGLNLSGTAEEVAARYPDKPKARKRQPKVKHGAAATPAPTASFEGTREQWLNAFVDRARPAFKAAGHELPEKVRVSVGFTGARGGGKVLGACWHEEASTDGTREIFVVPTIDDSALIAGVLTHELCHTLFGPDEKHGKRFKASGAAVGLVGKPTAMLPPQDGEKGAWHEWADPILADLGPIPHARLDPSKSGVKKQSTRLLKAECETCGFTVRVTGKWVTALSERGLLPMCPDPTCESDVEADDDVGGYHSRMCVAVPGEEDGE